MAPDPTPRSARPSATTRRLGSAKTATLVGFVGFVSLQIALATITASTREEYYDPPYGLRLRRLRQAVARTPEPRALLLLGSSRIHRGIRPDLLARDLAAIPGGPTIVFNFGVPGGGPVRELLILGRLVRAGLRPEYAVIEVLPAHFNGGRRRPPEHGLIDPAGLELAESEALARYGFSPAELLRLWLPTRLFPWYGERFALLGRLAPRLVPEVSRRPRDPAIDDLGFFTSPASDGHRPDFTQIAIRDYCGLLAGFELGEKAILALRDLLDLCRRDRVRAALIMMPEGPTLRDACPPAVWPQIEELLATLSAEYAVPFVNAREWMAEEDFRDGHHLLAAGAQALSERLVREKLGPWIRSEALGRAGLAPGAPHE